MNTDLLHVVPYYHPNSGGPPVVVQRLLEEMSGDDIRSHVITTDACAPTGDNEWISRIPHGELITVVRDAKLGEFAWHASIQKTVDRAVQDARLVAIHGLWSWPNLAAMNASRRHGTPYVIMPHGMLDPNSLARGRFKKQLYGRLIEWPKLRNASAMVYTNAPEQELAESSVPNLPTGHIAPLGTDWPPDTRQQLASEFRARFPQTIGKDCVVFLGRLHPKKGLDLLLPAWRNIVSRHPNACLIIAGKGETKYESKIREQIASNEIDDSVLMAGMLNGRDKWGALAASTLFVLPSYQENFGLAVVESLASGTPVVISKRVNIWNPLQEAGAAAICDLQPNSISETTCTLLNEPDAISSMARAGKACVADNFDWRKTANRFHSLIERYSR